MAVRIVVVKHDCSHILELDTEADTKACAQCCMQHSIAIGSAESWSMMPDDMQMKPDDMQMLSTLVLLQGLARLFKEGHHPLVPPRLPLARW